MQLNFTIRYLHTIGEIQDWRLRGVGGGGGIQGVSSKQDENKYCLSLTKTGFYHTYITYTHNTWEEKKNR